MGLVDVLHRHGNMPEERMALEWLCAQGAPTIVVPRESEISRELMGGFFVPQNPTEATGITHRRKPRSFPRVRVDPDRITVQFSWASATIPGELEAAMAGLLSRLPRFGHSSSLCIAAMNEPVNADGELLEPSSEAGSSEMMLRVPYAGLLRDAERAFDAQGRDGEIKDLINAAAKTAKPEKMLKPKASSRGRYDPPHQWQSYSAVGGPEAIPGPWDSRLFVMRQIGGKRFDLLSTWQITEVLHKTLLSRWNDHGAEFGPIPGWLSGHETQSGTASAAGPRRQGTHLSLFPLPFVGSDHADGHILGLAMAVPRHTDAGIDAATQRIQWLRMKNALFGNDGRLRLHALDGSWEMDIEPHAELSPQRFSRSGLRSHRWTHASTSWDSVTPVILDRHPKPHFSRDPDAWASSCVEIISSSCLRLGLPRPVAVEVSVASALQGVPSASAFAAPAPRNGRPVRFHVHASVRFDAPVKGPLLIGAGRYRGYGLFLPSDRNGQLAETSIP
jgi:CRISPR-associated protein Csb2